MDEKADTEKLQVVKNVATGMWQSGIYYHANRMLRENRLEEMKPGRKFPKGPDKNSVFYFHDYYPYWTGKDDYASEKILNLKHYDEVSTYDFACEVMAVINELHAGMKVTEFDLVSIPCHKPGLISYTAGSIEQIKRFARETDINIHTERIKLYRKYEVAESSRQHDFEDRPGYWIQYHSTGVRINHALDSGKRSAVLILDDIVTTGAHMKACRKRLEEAGIQRENIICITMGKTIG